MKRKRNDDDESPSTYTPPETQNRAVKPAAAKHQKKTIHQVTTRAQSKTTKFQILQILQILQLYLPEPLTNVVRAFSILPTWFSMSGSFIFTWNPDTQTWIKSPPMRYYRRKDASGLIWKNQLWIVGNIGRSHNRQVESFNFQTQTWTIHPPTPFRGKPVLAGDSTGLFALYSNALIMYNPTTRKWTHKEPLHMDTNVRFTMVYTKNYLYVFYQTARVDRYHIPSDTWEHVTDSNHWPLKMSFAGTLINETQYIAHGEHETFTFHFETHQWTPYTVPPAPHVDTNEPIINHYTEGTMSIFRIQQTEPLYTIQHIFDASQGKWRQIAPITFPKHWYYCHMCFLS